MNPTNPASSPSVMPNAGSPFQFYVIAVLFVLFDVEVILMYPWAVTARQLGLFGLIEMAIFLVILLVGFYLSWKNGAFKWQ